MTDHQHGTPADVQPEAGLDPRSDEELRRTRQAQDAHGGSMAPGLVDETGQPVGDVPALGGPGDPDTAGNT